MSKIKMDLETAKWVADKAQNEQNDIAAFPVEFVECEKCGAVFMPELGHDCNNVIELEFNEVTEAEVTGLLCDMALSLAVIADKLTEDKDNEQTTGT